MLTSSQAPVYHFRTLRFETEASSNNSNLTYYDPAYCLCSGDQGFLNSYFSGFANAPVFDGKEDHRASDQRYMRLPTRYNADIGLYVINSNRWSIPASEIRSSSSHNLTTISLWCPAVFVVGCIPVVAGYHVSRVRRALRGRTLSAVLFTLHASPYAHGVESVDVLSLQTFEAHVHVLSLGFYGLQSGALHPGQL